MAVKLTFGKVQGQWRGPEEHPPEKVYVLGFVSITGTEFDPEIQAVQWRKQNSFDDPKWTVLHYTEGEYETVTVLAWWDDNGTGLLPDLTTAVLASHEVDTNLTDYAWHECLKIDIDILNGVHA